MQNKTINGTGVYCSQMFTFGGEAIFHSGTTQHKIYYSIRCSGLFTQTLVYL